MLEEPQLLLDYVAGKTRSVALVPSAPAAAEAPARADATQEESAPDVAARPAAPSAPQAAPAHQAGASPGNRVPAAAPPPPAVAPVPIAAEQPPAAPPGAARGFSVQVGAFADSGPAAQLARRLEDKGLPVYVSPSAGADAKKWRVRVGPLATRDEADRVAARLEKQEKLPTWVMAEGTL
jgi:DedD protein